MGEHQCLDSFGAATRNWFLASFAEPTPVQARGWPHVASGEHALLLAPTGSGKTLAAFLWCIDRLMARAPAERGDGVRVLYVSPLKALAYDVERNLRAPLIGIQQTARRHGASLVPPRVAIRSGDTPQKERRVWAREPGEILVTTPESLYLILGSEARRALCNVETVIVDEVHALAPTKRGAHLALSLERLSDLCQRDPQRVGLSATARPVEEVARYLGGDRPVAVVDASAAPRLDLEVVVPVADMTRPELVRSGGAPGAGAQEAAGERGAAQSHGMWPAIVPELYQLIESHRTTIVFVNSRALCERLVQRICEHAGQPVVRAHHGSLSHAHRREVEELLKTGRIRGIVATSSLELGIDMGAVDLVVMVESPGAVARGLQRVGRAGHHVGEVSKGRIFPKHRGDLLEAAVVAQRMRGAEIEPLCIPKSPLDVLSQQVVAMCSLEARLVMDVERIVRRASSYTDLPKEALIGVLDMLSGRYPSTDFAELRPRLVWDRDADTLSPRAGSRMLAIVSGGTIPDRGTYGVFLVGSGARVGELDEEMVHEIQQGQVITLGASSWRVDEISRDRVMVVPAPGEVGRMPFWHGDGPGRPIELGRAMGAFVRELESRLGTADVATWLKDRAHLDRMASENLIAHVREQIDATGVLPTDRSVVVESFKDELGDHRVCILSPFGARVHAPWALALKTVLGRHSGLEVQLMWTDDGICMRLVDADELPGLDALVPDAEEVEELVLSELGDSALFASHFRENAARALLLPRRRPGSRTPLWQQRLRAQKLLAVARAFPAFPIVVETYRQCLRDVFDMPALVELLGAIRRREVRVHAAQTASPSPFARSLVFAYVAAYLYEGDAPLAERRAQALSLDRNLLRELLGHEELRELLDPDVIVELQAELSALSEDRKARGVDGVHDLLRRLGTLTLEELTLRTEGDAATTVQALVRARRVVAIPIAGQATFIAAEDAGLYRDAVGAVIPSGVPLAFLGTAHRPIEALLARWARCRGPFAPLAFVERHGLALAAAEPAFEALEREGRLVRGAFSRDGRSVEWCDAEVLRRIKRRTLARMRGEVEPVTRETFARFLPAWHGVDASGRGLRRLEEVIVQLEGMPLSHADLERSILPARVRDFSPRMLDELGAMGTLVWVGHGALGSEDGRVALYRRDRVTSLLEPPEPPAELSPLAHGVLDALEARGACFFSEIESALEGLQAPDSRLRAAEMSAALWDLVWAGLVTNDTFEPLRALSMRGSAGASRRGASNRKTAGRWSLVKNLTVDARSATERAHARALMLLERHGVVSREVAAIEAIPGGFSALYLVLRSMEDAGKLRRGYFVEGIGGAQFAYAGAVDRLRSLRGQQAHPQVVVIATSDPANPFGWLLPWPELVDATRTPRRAAGALLALVDGGPAIFLERGGRSLYAFAGVDDEVLARAVAGLSKTLARHATRSLRIESIDGQPALASPRAAKLKALGIGFDHKGFVIERQV